jgi:hypothetical protein
LGLFDLAWQHEPPIIKADSREHQATLPQQHPAQDKALIGFRRSNTPLNPGNV